MVLLPVACSVPPREVDRAGGAQRAAGVQHERAGIERRAAGVRVGAAEGQFALRGRRVFQRQGAGAGTAERAGPGTV